MSEKYRINPHEDCENIILFDTGRIVCKKKDGSNDGELALKVLRLLNEEEKRKSLPKNINIKQINIVPVQNTCTTQCYAYMYALDNEGILWFKRDNDTKWTKESLECE